jgi:hypothetical protein
MSAFLGAQPPPEYFLGAEPPLELFSGSATETILVHLVFFINCEYSLFSLGYKIACKDRLADA